MFLGALFGMLRTINPARFSGGGEGEVWILRVDGQNVKPLTFRTSDFPKDPVIS